MEKKVGLFFSNGFEFTLERVITPGKEKTQGKAQSLPLVFFFPNTKNPIKIVWLGIIDNINNIPNKI